MRKRHLVTSLLAAATVALASGAVAQESSTTDVTLVHIAGSRGMNIASVGGGDFTSVSFGTVREIPFLANVTDVNYDHVGYELNASMSNLYPLNDSLAPNCDPGTDNFIPSSALSVGFPLSDALSLVDLSSLSEPVFKLTGTLTAPLAGLPANTVLESTIDGHQLDIDALLDNLPLLVENGAGGSFAAALAHPGCSGSGAETPTAVGIQSGDRNTLFDLEALADGLFDTIDGDINGTVMLNELVGSGIISSAEADEAVVAALEAANAVLPTVPLLLDPIVAEVRSLMTVAIDITGLLGQSGSYTTVANLLVAQLGASLPGGLYGGRLEFTLVDTE